MTFLTLILGIGIYVCTLITLITSLLGLYMIIRFYMAKDVMDDITVEAFVKALALFLISVFTRFCVLYYAHQVYNNFGNGLKEVYFENMRLGEYRNLATQQSDQTIREGNLDNPNNHNVHTCNNPSNSYT